MNHDNGCCEDYGLVAVKQRWVPERVWRVLCWLWLPIFGYLICIQPFMWMLTEKPKPCEARTIEEEQ